MGGGIILQKFTTRCGNNLYLPAHGNHMPQADIRLESTQSVLKEMDVSGHVVINV